MTDRIILYPGSVPLETDTMFAETGAMVGLGYLAQMILGAGSVADGLACTPTAPASLTVNVGPGSIATLATVDATAMSSQAANSAPLVKLGINLASTAFIFAAPGTSGQSINYLIEGQLLESDGTPLALSYYNATNPALPYVGPANSGSAQNTQRTQRVSLQVKNGTAANAGTQTTPGVDAGWSGLWIVTVNYGQTQITSSSIAQHPAAPFIPAKLPNLAPGFSRMTTFTSSQNWTVPLGVTRCKVRLWGAGGSNPSSTSLSYPSGGGGAGAYGEQIFGLTPGAVIPVGVGVGAAGAAGGASSFLTAFVPGGTNGGAGTTSAPGGAGGASAGPTGCSLGLAGATGSSGATFSGGNIQGGIGAAAFGGSPTFAIGSSGTALPCNAGALPGCGASGGTGAEAAGGNGLVIVEY